MRYFVFKDVFWNRCPLRFWTHTPTNSVSVRPVTLIVKAKALGMTSDILSKRLALKEYACMHACMMFLLILHLKMFVNFLYIHAYNTRFSCADNLFVPKSRLHMKLKSFLAFGTKLRNCLHSDWRKLTKRAFKRTIDGFTLLVASWVIRARL